MHLIEVDGVAAPRRVAQDLARSRFRIDVDGPKLVVAVANGRRDELERIVASWERDGVVRAARLLVA